MNNVWVILNEAMDEIVQVFETADADSKRHWDLFFQHRPGCVFCGKATTAIGFLSGKTEKLTWYYNYFYWEDQSRWGYGDPDGIGWSAAMTLPEPIKMLVFVGGMYGSDR